MAGGGPIGGGGDWLRGGLGTAIANATNMLAGPGQQIMGQYGNPLAQLAQQQLGNNTDAMSFYLGGQNGQGGLLNNFGNYGNYVDQSRQGYIDASMNPALMQGAQGGMQGAAGSLNPGLQAAGGQFANMAGGLGNTAGLAGQEFAAGGWTPQYQQGFDQISNIFNGGGAGNPGGASQFEANNLIKSGGQTGFNLNATNLANGVMSSGGFNPYIQMGKDPTQNILNAQGAGQQSNALMGGGQDAINGMYGTGGLTPTGATAEAAGLQGILQGGGNPYNIGAQNQGLQYMQQPALMSPEQAASIASNQAGTTARTQVQQDFEKAMARGGGPGAITGGIQNEGMNDAADKISQAQSQAFQQSLLNQQQLQLQQQAQGTQMFNVGAGNQLGNLQAASGLQGQNENVAAQRFGTGASMLGQSGQLQNNQMQYGLGNANAMSNAAANYISPYGQYGSNAMGNMSSMLGQGGNLASILQQGQQGGLQSLGNLMGNQNQYAIGMGNLQNTATQGMGGLMNNMAGTQGNIYNNLFGTGINQGQLGVGQFQALTGAMNAGMGQQLGLGSLMNSQQGTWMNPLQTYGMQVGPQMLQQGVTGPGSWLSGGAGGGANPITEDVTKIITAGAEAAGKAASAGSSIDFKENIKEIGDESEKLYSLHPMTYKYKLETGFNQEKEYGLIAEEVAEVYPEIVIFNDKKPVGINYRKFIPLLLNEIQKLNVRINELKG